MPLRRTHWHCQNARLCHNYMTTLPAAPHRRSIFTHSVHLRTAWPPHMAPCHIQNRYYDPAYCSSARVSIHAFLALVRLYVNTMRGTVHHLSANNLPHEQPSRY
jgi:hypothetical protein